MELGEFLTYLTWEAVREPVILGLVVATIMVFLVKPLLDLLFAYLWRRMHGEEPIPEDWAARGIVTNVIVFVLCFVIGAGRLASEWPGFGSVFMLALSGALVATSSYETVKNGLKVIGVDISHLNVLL